MNEEFVVIGKGVRLYVNHYAKVIAARAKLNGLLLNSEFGVPNSTREYREHVQRVIQENKE